jgi:phytoene dehydrogenase-like protein
MGTDADVIVVGAGLAGLAAAASARQCGARVLVLEAHQLGGRARCAQRDGFTFNMGAHALYRDGAGEKVLASLGVTPEGAPPPLARYRAEVGGRLHLLPTGPGSLVRTGALGGRSKAQLAGVLAALPRMDARQFSSVTVGEWLRDRRLRPDAAALVRALIRLGTYTADTESFSAEAALAQMQIAARGGVRYLHGGWDQLTDALARGLEIRTQVEVAGVERAGSDVEVRTAQGSLLAHRVVLAPGGPEAVRRLLPVDPGWGRLGHPVTAACLDLALSEVPGPGYVLSVDEPTYATVQSPPARQAPEGGAVAAVIRYGARSAAEDRPLLEAKARLAGVESGAVRTSRFLACMTVTGAMPIAAAGGFGGRPRHADTGVPGVTMAGDWVGPEGLLADASLASGRASGLEAGREVRGSSKMVA